MCQPERTRFHHALTGTRPTLMITDAAGAVPLTMSTLASKELLGRRHDSVKRTVERLAHRGLFTLPPMVETSYIDSAGKRQWTSVYLLDKRSSCIVVAQQSPEFKYASQVPVSLPEALRLAADLAEENAALLQETQRMLPDALVGERSNAL